jgi:hypothetical protein
VTAGALAGLFTDPVLQQMQRILAATDPDRQASQQDTPLTPTASTPIDKTGAVKVNGPKGGPNAEHNENALAATQLPKQRPGDHVAGKAKPHKKGGPKK